MKNSLIFFIAFVFLGAASAPAQQDITDGFHKVTQADGDVYEGEFQNGLYNGHGTLTMADGQRYVGGFKDGLYDGYGVLTYTDGSQYKGQFQEGLLNGQGTINYADSGGQKYKGKFKYGDIEIDTTAPADSNSQVNAANNTK